MSEGKRIIRGETSKRAARIVSLLKKEYPNAGCSLTYRIAHELLIATILSAQTADEQVNKITPALFARYRSIEDFALADIKELEKRIRSIGLFRGKARAIRESAVMICRQYDGIVPDSLDKLIRLPGVGRKTASVVLGTWFGKAEGIVVDTHVRRLSRLLGLTNETDPAKIERDLMQVINKKSWIIFTHLMIDHGRAICIARRPRCGACVLSKLCPSARI